MQIVPAWPPVACNMNKITEICMLLAATGVQFACNCRPLGYNLHATGGHSVTRQETSRQEVCKRPPLHHNYIFLSLGSPHPRPCFWLFSWRPLDIWFGNCAGTMDDKATQKQILHALAASCVQGTRLLQARCENNYLNKKMKTPLKNLRIYPRHASFISAIHQHYAWPDPIS